MRLKDRLRELRVDAGFSVRDVASKLGKSPGYISRVEGRGEIPSVMLLCDISLLYGVDVEELLTLAKAAQLEATKQQIDLRHTEALKLFRKDQK